MIQDIAASERFYVEVLGLQVDAERTNRPSFVLLRSGNCMVILQGGDPAGENQAIELAFAADDVRAMQQKLGDKALVQQMGWGSAIETMDPDGTRINLYQS